MTTFSFTIRSISSTPTLNFAVPAANKKKAAPETPKVSQKKVGNEEKKGPSASKLEKQVSHESRIEALLIKACDAPTLVPPRPALEEAMRRYHVGRNYVIGSFVRHNAMYHDLAVKIRMKRYAIRMLPRENYDLGDDTVIAPPSSSTSTSSKNKGGEDGLQQQQQQQGAGRSVYGRWKSEVLAINGNWGPPEHRHVPMYTPPIPGFDVNLYADREDEDN